MDSKTYSNELNIVIDKEIGSPWGKAGPPIPGAPTTVERPAWLNDEIARFLFQGTVNDLMSERGQFLKDFFTAGEVARSIGLPMPECRGFDGATCDACRGHHRFIQCPECHGDFANIALRPKTLDEEHAERAREIEAMRERLSQLEAMQCNQFDLSILPEPSECFLETSPDTPLSG